MEYSLRGRSRAAATSKMERFVVIVNGWKPLTIITKCSILDVEAALDPPLISNNSFKQILILCALCQLKDHTYSKKVTPT